MNPLEVFNAQVHAFNAHDVDRFLSSYAPDAVVTSTVNDPLVGHDAMRAHYTKRLANTALHCDVLATSFFGGRWIVAHELVKDGSATAEVIATFEVTGGRIVRASLVVA